MPGSASASPRDPPLTLVEPTDVALAMEVLYTGEGTRLLVVTLAHILRRPNDVCYLMNNARRTGVTSFDGACARNGLAVERLPGPSSSEELGDSSVTSTFVPCCGDHDEEYVFLKVTHEGLERGTS